MRGDIFIIVIIFILAMLSISLFFATTKPKNRLKFGIGSIIVIFMVKM